MPDQGLTSGLQARRILVVEDDAEFAAELRHYLLSQDCQVRVVTNGADALRAVMESDFDAVLCDIAMPRAAGDMLYYAVQRVKPALCERFVFLTAHGESARVRAFLNQVSEAVLKRPFHLDDLRETLQLLFRGGHGPRLRLELPSGPPVIRPIGDRPARPWA
jgi:DNA-binding response OmpR family regulator